MNQQQRTNRGCSRRSLLRAVIVGLTVVLLSGCVKTIVSEAANPEEAYQQWLENSALSWKWDPDWAAYSLARAQAATSLQAGNYATAESRFRDMLENPDYPPRVPEVFVGTSFEAEAAESWDAAVTRIETELGFLLAFSQAAQDEHSDVVRTIRSIESQLDPFFERFYKEGGGHAHRVFKDRTFFEYLYAHILTVYARSLAATGESDQAVAQYTKAAGLGSATGQASAQQLKSRLAELKASMRQKLLGAAEADMAGRLGEALDLYAGALRDSTALTGGSSLNENIAEKAVAVALRISPAPVVPEAARRRAFFGQALVRDAGDASAFDEAAREYIAAVTEAPWWPDVYINLGLLQEERGQFEDAVTALRLYLMAAPTAPDGAAVRVKISELTRRARLSEAER